MPAILNGKTQPDPLLPRYSYGGSETELGTLHRKPPKSESTIINEGISAPAPSITIEEIYRAPEFGTIELSSALALLKTGLELCNRALVALEQDEPLQADDAMIQLQAVMPELFCCRAVGDGLAEIANAVQSAFENLNGQPIARAQIEAVWNALVALRNEPRLSFDRSLPLVSAMEQTGLLVDPAAIDTLSEWLSE